MRLGLFQNPGKAPGFYVIPVTPKGCPSKRYIPFYICENYRQLMKDLGLERAHDENLIWMFEKATIIGNGRRPAEVIFEDPGYYFTKSVL